MTYGLDNCLCPWDENGSLTRFARGCPIHGSLAAPSPIITQPWCDGSSEPSTGTCRFCKHEVPTKYGIAGVHLRDGSTPRE